MIKRVTVARTQLTTNTQLVQYLSNRAHPTIKTKTLLDYAKELLYSSTVAARTRGCLLVEKALLKLTI